MSRRNAAAARAALAPAVAVAPAVMTLDAARVHAQAKLADRLAEAKATYDGRVARFRDDAAVNPLQAISSWAKPIAEAEGGWLAWRAAVRVFDAAAAPNFEDRLEHLAGWLADQKDSLFRSAQSFHQSTCGVDNAIEGNKRAGYASALALLGHTILGEMTLIGMAREADARRAQTAAAAAERAEALAYAADGIDGAI